MEPVGASLNQPDLEKEILIAIAEAARPADTRALNLLRKAARESGWGIWLIPSLARIDGDWLCQHTEIIPHRMISVLPPLTPGQREIVVRNLAPWPGDVVAGISSDFWSQFPPEEAKHLKKLMESLHAAGPAPNYLFRVAMVMIVGCLSLFFIVFLIWGSRLAAKSRDINFLNEFGDYEAARRLSEQTRKQVNKALIAALTIGALTIGLMVALQYGWIL